MDGAKSPWSDTMLKRIPAFKRAMAPEKMAAIICLLRATSEEFKGIAQAFRGNAQLVITTEWNILPGDPFVVRAYLSQPLVQNDGQNLRYALRQRLIVL